MRNSGGEKGLFSKFSLGRLKNRSYFQWGRFQNIIMPQFMQETINFLIKILIC